MAVAYAQAYNDTANGMAVKSFIEQASGCVFTNCLRKYKR